MNRWIYVHRLLWIVSAVCVALPIGHIALGQQQQPTPFAFVPGTQLVGPNDQIPPLRNLGDQGVEVRASDYNPSYQRRTLIPIMPGSVAILDSKGKGASYLYFTESGRPNLLFQSTPDGGFRNITDRAGVSGPEGGVSAIFGDYDRSRRQSLFVVGAEGVTLYRNDGNNVFSNMTHKAGLQMRPGVLCTSAALGDFDGDGFPDLIVAAYTDLNAPPSKPVFKFPNDFHGADSRLFRNNGNGTFTDVTESSGLGNNPGRARNVILADFNNDRNLDILLLRDDKPPALYMNRGRWRFEEATWDAGDDLTTHAFFDGVVTDFNRDGKTDLALWSTHSFRILINQGNATFERADSPGLPEPLISLFGFRGLSADLDGDGFDDIITVDQQERLRAFANHAGQFREVSLVLPQGFVGSHLVALQGGGSRAPRILAIKQDGSVVLLEMKRR